MRLHQTLLFIAVLTASSAGAQNLLTNGSFDEDLSGWSVSDNTVVGTRWDGMDVGGSSSSGSVSVTNKGPEAGALRAGASQCINILPGARYRFRADVLIPNGQPAAGYAEVSIFYFAGADCDGFNGSTGLRAEQRGDWQQVLMDVNVPSTSRSARINLAVYKQVEGGSLQAFFDRVFVLFQSSAACVNDARTLCLNGGRFRVTADWTRPSSETGEGTAVMLTQDTGYFWFFRNTNVEMIVKVLSGCANNGNYWVFAGGLTNVGVDLRVEDTETGQVQNYFNPVEEPFQPIQDTMAFATCP